MTPVRNESRQLQFVECRVFLSLLLVKSKFQKNFSAMYLTKLRDLLLKPPPIKIKYYNVVTRWDAEFTTLTCIQFVS